jgi:hypothetical protein
MRAPAWTIAPFLRELEHLLYRARTDLSSAA